MAPIAMLNLGNVAAADAMLTRGIEIAAEQSQLSLKQGALALKEVIAEYTQRGAAPQSSREGVHMGALAGGDVLGHLPNNLIGQRPLPLTSWQRLCC